MSKPTRPAHPPPSPRNRIATRSRSRARTSARPSSPTAATKRVFTHTEVDKDYEGRGLATILIAQALQETRDAGLRIVPRCPMVAAYVKKHDEYQDIVDN